MGLISPINVFLDQHKNQLLSSGIPELYWESLYRKLLNQTFDAGQSFQLVKIEYDECPKPHEPVWGLQAIKDLDKNDSEHIYLVDHAWTYHITEAKKNLQYDSLRVRLANILGLDPELPREELIEKIFETMWRINGTYNVRNMENTEQTQMWYVTDEIGCALQHSDNPNCRMVPFFYLSGGIYSLLFLQESIEEGELMCRDFAEGITDIVRRKAALLPWVPSTFEDVDVLAKIPDEEYFVSGHITETLPEVPGKLVTLQKDKKYLCYTQYDLIAKYLNDEKFEITTNEGEADILWYTEHFRDFKKLSEENPNKFINQFPYEYVLTVKDLLCMTCRRYKNNSLQAPWFPITYNLVNEVGNFAKYFQKQESEGAENNYWIIKPYNLARGMDMHITNNLNYIMRLPATGPKIVQKYLTNPVLFYRPECEGKVKFDLRYVILLKSIKPLEVFVYKNFFLRFANKPFELTDFDDYEKHFTVMNYTEGVVLKHMKCEEFKVEWQVQYASYNWEVIEKKILEMLRNIMECATAVEPPCGIAENAQSRALYAADLMLDWQNQDMQPKILEINYMPDCDRACKYYPNFYNDIFKLLFLNEDSGCFFKL
ncbi:tubulin--tyrosine ligase-like protein 12 [Euwallacea fornicatus]|uniref:tubulin--tyrosine ligase-like protein 12 n=1 Tax=Euwallacea fornicatus TaxID=995702 RepID=UPI00338EABFE